MISVVVADDQQLVREGLVALLAAAPDIRVVGEAPDGRAAVEQARQLAPEVVLMDVRMPVLDGLRATAEIIQAGCGTRVLMLTTFDLDEYVFQALQAGASGFLLKDVSGSDLAKAVRVVAAGDALLAPSVTRRLIGELTRRRSVGNPGGAEGLTARELDVLRLVAKGRSNTEITGDLHLAEPTVKTYVGRLLAKLGLRDRTQIVVYAYERGLVD